MNRSLVAKPAFWIVVLVASALCVFAVLRWFGDAFPVLDLDVRMSRATAIAAAREIALAKHLSDATLTEAAASFDGNASAQTFIELEGGGKPALKPLLGGDEFALYRWQVRLFSPGVEREVRVGFTPDGRPTGFFSKVPESEPGAALPADDARAIATASAARDWGVDFARYRPLTASATTQPGKRVDHEFVYERRLETAPPIGDGRLRLRLVVSGDRLTLLQRFVYVPEAFVRRYETMRSANDNIARAASVAAGLLYGLGGCLVGLIWLMRRHAIRWAPSAKWAAVVAALIAGAAMSAASANWFGYDTATSASTHRFAGIAGALTGGVVTWLLLTVVFATAEGLGRLAFGRHPQLWRTWRTPSANAREIWGRTLAGYAWIGFDLAFIALFYFLVQRYLGWWSPSDSLVDPNILGKPQPWLAPVSMALQAGMMEECLFRAVPLAGAALLGRRFGRERLFVGVALVVQAVIFGCAHANYPGQPAYARPVELFVPALVWGVVYLRYGLLPGILFHFGFDLVLMSLPLFVTDAAGVGFDRAMVVGILALPLVVLAVQRLRASRLIDLPDGERNAAWGPAPPATRAVEEVVGTPPVAVPTAATAPPSRAPTRPRELALFGIFALVGLIGIGAKIARPFDAPGLVISRDQAVAIGERALADRGVTLDARWHRSVKAFGTTDPAASRFLWREGGPETYAQTIGGSLAPPHWEVRFARFDGDVADRDTWRVVVVDDRPAPDGVRTIEHDVPEARPGKRLAEADARSMAERAISSWLRLDAGKLRPVSARADEKPQRVDWLFVYADPAVVLPKGAEGRIVVDIDGDEVAAVGRSVFVPDAWARDERRRNDGLLIPRFVLGIVGLAFMVGLLVSLVRRIARGEVSKRAAWVVALLVPTTVVAGALLDLDATRFAFTVAEPYGAQMLSVILQSGGMAIGGALLGALVAAVGVRIARRAEAVGPPAGSPRQRWFAAIALAAFAVGLGGYARWLGPASSPRLPAVGGADALVPVVGAFLGEVDFTATASIALLVAAMLSSRRRRVEALFAAGVVVAAVAGRASTADATLTSIVFAGVAGALAWFLYRWLIRDRLWLVAPTLLCIAVLGHVTALAHAAYPASRLDALAALVAAFVGYRIWRWLVDDDRPSSIAEPAVTPLV